MSGSLSTPLCELLGIDVPILCAGMGWVAGPELVAAVSEAGGLGVLGNGGAEPDAVRAQIRRTRALTEKPFGVNLLCPEISPDDRRHVELIASEGTAALVFFWGDPASLVEAARPAKVLLQVGSVQEAEAAAAAGVDAIIAQGLEAGGHLRGTTSVWDLVPAVAEAVSPLPVLASGGIGDAAGLARALSLGAQGVSLGTRFVASDEADAHPDYKRRIVEARAADTVYTADLYDVGWPDAPHRTLRNRNLAEWEAGGRAAPGERPGEGTSIGTMRPPFGEPYDWHRYSVGAALSSFDGDLDYAPLWAGESVEDVKDVRPAGALVRELADGAAALLR